MKSFFLILAFVVCYVSATSATGQTKDSVFEDFDARPLSSQEKKLLQAALTFRGYYNGLLDGKWGAGSQSALERYAWDEHALEPTNAHMAFLAFSFIDDFQTYGWRMKFFPSLNLTLALPFESMIEIGALEWEQKIGSVRVKAYSLSAKEKESLHHIADRLTNGRPTQYQVRNRDRWVTAGIRQDSWLVYSRSDWNGEGWASVSITANPKDKNTMQSIASSISVGSQDSWGIPAGGYLDRMIELTSLEFANVEQAETGVSATSEPQVAKHSTGTGIRINGRGGILTNHHVIKDCETVTIENNSYLVTFDSVTFDLAYLEPSTLLEVAPFAHFANKSAGLNSDVTVVGFPLSGLLGGLNVTRGAIASMKGIRGDETNMQISAPVQPGNSGGPVLNTNGQIVGVVVAKLDALKTADLIGDIPQNINFAIRGEVAKLFLSVNGIPFTNSDEMLPLSPERLAEQASEFTVLVDCGNN